MSLDLQPTDPKLPEDDSAPVSSSNREGPFALKALVGFIGAPFALALSLPANSPALGIIMIAVAFIMLFFRPTRAYALGALLFIGVAFLVLLAICGQSLKGI